MTDDPIVPAPLPLFVPGANAPALPVFDRACPPQASDLPRLLTPTQVGVVFGLSTEAARNDGNRKKLGSATVIDDQKYYRAEDVVRRWHERFDEKPSANKVQTAQQPNSSADTAELVLRVVAAMERIAGGRGEQQETAAALARTVEAQQQEIRRLTEALEAERGRANGRPRTWWARLFGG